MSSYSFQANIDDVKNSIEKYISIIVRSLESEILIMPKGEGFIEYKDFEQAYEFLKKKTNEFSILEPIKITNCILEMPLTFIVLRTILGLSSSELAYLASQRKMIEISQSYARTFERKIRFNPMKKISITSLNRTRLEALIESSCELIKEGVSKINDNKIHRLDKADTSQGLIGVQNLTRMGVPYAMLLYERFLGRPFASHRDSISELVGDQLETIIENILINEGISYRKTKRAEKISGFDQAPDFIIPSEYNPKIVIEAKVTNDDGTARDKITRIQHLSENQNDYQLIACISGRGFGVRKEDMKKLLLATKGKVFTLNTLNYLVQYTDLHKYKTK